MRFVPHADAALRPMAEGLRPDPAQTLPAPVSMTSHVPGHPCFDVRAGRMEEAAAQELDAIIDCLGLRYLCDTRRTHDVCGVGPPVMDDARDLTAAL